MMLIKWDQNITEDQKQAHRALIRRTRPVAKSLGIRQGRDGMYAKWHPGIQAMAKDVKLSSDYHITYRRLSQTEHTDPESVREYLKEGERREIVHGDVGPSTEYAPLVMWDSIRYFLNIKRDAAPILGFEEDPEELAVHGRLLRKHEDSFADS